ncbi:MAG: metal-dependent hydrolase [Acidobacteria bacterium]|nr:metal-dependent hydrolase [Acidobacteriota bacterium]
MFAGHFGLGFGAKAAAPRVSLGTLFLAAQLVDLLWPTLLLFGLESVEIAPGITRLTPLDFTHYPISHSLLAVLGWAVLFAVIYFLARKSLRGAVICGILVFSHWVLDFLTHRPDLPLFPGSETRVGLGLWNHPVPAIGLELLILAVGVFLYARSTRATDRTGSMALWTLVAFLLLIYLSNLFGPPPPSVQAIAWMGHAQWLLVLWAYWIDRHRQPAGAPEIHSLG